MMKKIFVFGFIAAMTFGFGCALTNYSLITDNDQGGVVNTNGKASIQQSSQVALGYPDGNDNLQWLVDQKANGDRVLNTYNFATSGTASPFKDDTYCSPDWTGCSVSTSQDPEVGDTSIFDYNANFSCFGARSLSLLLSSSRYYGECGRTAVRDRSTRMIALANDMTPVTINGATWLHTNLNALNTNIVLSNQSGAFALPMTSQVGLSINFAQRRALADLTNPNNRNLAQNAINWNTAHPGAVHATITVNGQSFDYNVKGTNQAPSWPNVHY